MKKVSVIIPVYNVEKYLPKCLDSVVSQTYSELQIICVDDGSPDRSADIIRRYMEKDSRIELIQQKNTGLSGARNTGIKKAEGDFIVFLDSDDWLDTEAIGEAVKTAEENGCDTVLWGYTREFPGKAIPKIIFDRDRIFGKEETSSLIHRRMAGLLGDELKNPENADSIVTAWGKLYSTSFIKENSLEFVDTKIIGTEDALFNLYYFKFSERSAFINKPFNHYRKDNETSLTRSYKPKLISQWSVLYKMMGDYIKENNLPAEFSQALRNRICLSMTGLGLNELCNKEGFRARIKNLSKILSSAIYRDAYSHLDTGVFPLHWKIFFIMCRDNHPLFVYLLLKAIQMLIGK